MIEEMLQDPYLLATVTSVGSILIAIILSIIISFVNKKILAKSESPDPKVLRKIKRTIIVFVVSTGIYFGLKQLPELTNFVTRMAQTYFVFTALIIALILSQIVSAFIRYHVRQAQRHQNTPRIVDLVISIIIFTVAIITILQYFQVEITAIIATLGIGGIAIGLALQGTLANLFSGIHLIATEPIRVGDFIGIEFLDLKGYVVDIGWRETKIRQINNTIVIIPNNKLAESVIVNNSMPEEQMGCRVEVGIDYTSNLEHVEKVTLEVAKKAQEEIEGAIRDHVPLMRFHTFADSNINFTVYLRVERYYDTLVMTHEFIKRLKSAYDNEGIEISWPIRKVYNK
jgi:small-conductance mechanosensitive channel